MTQHLALPTYSDSSTYWLSDRDALTLANHTDTASLMATASHLRDQGFGNRVTYSRKVFIPLTHLCRDVCHYCTFAKTPKRIEQAYLPLDEVINIAREGQRAGCKEALFTLGERPELRYKAARDALATMGFSTTLEYLAAAAKAVLEQTGLIPHLNPGCMSAEEIAPLRQVSASMGIMLESASDRLCEKGMPHYGSPDKEPARRLATLTTAGIAKVPFTTGILIGIGETRLERIESLLAIREIHQQYGHIQEIIIQNFRAKPDTKMSQAPEPDLNELLWTLAVARMIFGPQMSIQAPPNLSPGVLPNLINAGINDWGGVSPLTPDHVNPEAPWPHLEKLAQESEAAGKYLEERLTLYPEYALNVEHWLDPILQTPIRQAIDGGGFPRTDSWLTGQSETAPKHWLTRVQQSPNGKTLSQRCQNTVAELLKDRAVDANDIAELFKARGDDFNFICQTADRLRQEINGDDVTYVVNRNINYTNICYFHCRFCAFSKGKSHAELRGKPYDLSSDEIQRRSIEAWQRGATEVCMQGGIHPSYTGQTYIDICQAVKAVTPEMHIHAFSPLEIWQGAQTLNIDLRNFLQQLQQAGLATLPGTAAEVLDDEVRQILCADKINTDEWLEVMETAHSLGIRTTATIMFGHVDHYRHWANHLLHILKLQKRTGGFTEFVPLPFVAHEAPIYRRGEARQGPTFRESVLMHAIARIVFHRHLPNIQASWVKMGPAGISACLQAGVNDLGGTLMNESITRAAGASYGQENSPESIENIIQRCGRHAKQRTTLYGTPKPSQIAASFAAQPLTELDNHCVDRKTDKTKTASGKQIPSQLLTER